MCRCKLPRHSICDFSVLSRIITASRKRSTTRARPAFPGDKLSAELFGRAPRARTADRRSPRPHRALVDGARHGRGERNQDRAGNFVEPLRSLASDSAIARAGRGCSRASGNGISAQVGSGSAAARNSWARCFAAPSSTISFITFTRLAQPTRRPWRLRRRASPRAACFLPKSRPRDAGAGPTPGSRRARLGFIARWYCVRRCRHRKCWCSRWRPGWRCARPLSRWKLACSVDLKWPNDVLIKGRKVCGILTEMNAEATRVRYIVVGIGINVNQKSFPKEIENEATSLRHGDGQRMVARGTGRGFAKIARPGISSAGRRAGRAAIDSAPLCRAIVVGARKASLVSKRTIRESKERPKAWMSAASCKCGPRRDCRQS